jgi:hypothetical protein
MVMWRVFGVSDVFNDRPLPAWSVSETIPEPNAGELTVMIGDLPNELTTTIRQWRAQARGALSRVFGQQVTSEQQLAWYRSDLDTVKLSEFEEPYPVWLIFQVTKPVEVVASQNTVGWLTNVVAVVNELESFGKTGSGILDRAVACVLGARTEERVLNVGLMRFSHPWPYLIAPGRAAITIPRLVTKVKDSGVTVIRNDGWRSAPAAEIADAVRSIPHNKSADRLIGRPAALLCAALGEQDDALRRFIFAFSGLEVLATQAEIAARDKLIGRIISADSGLPVAALLWPSTDNDKVWRNSVFRFASMATIYSPDTAIEDVESFKKIVDARRMYHGSGPDIDEGTAIVCQTLLSRYLGLVARGYSGS